MNLRIAKAFRTTPSEALRILAGLAPIIIKTEEAVKLYELKERERKPKTNNDREVELKNWFHPADTVKIIEGEENKESTIQLYTDGSKI